MNNILEVTFDSWPFYMKGGNILEISLSGFVCCRNAAESRRISCVSVMFILLSLLDALCLNKHLPTLPWWDSPSSVGTVHTHSLLPNFRSYNDLTGFVRSSFNNDGKCSAKALANSAVSFAFFI